MVKGPSPLVLPSWVVAGVASGSNIKGSANRIFAYTVRRASIQQTTAEGTAEGNQKRYRLFFGNDPAWVVSIAGRPTVGMFTLTVTDPVTGRTAETPPIPWDAGASGVTSAIRAALGGDRIVVGHGGRLPGIPVTITFPTSVNRARRRPTLAQGRSDLAGGAGTDPAVVVAESFLGHPGLKDNDTVEPLVLTAPEGEPFRGTMAAPVGTSDTIINLVSAAGFPAAGTKFISIGGVQTQCYEVLIDGERIAVVGWIGMPRLLVIRGINGTVPAPHAAGSDVLLPAGSVLTCTAKVDDVMQRAREFVVPCTGTA